MIAGYHGPMTPDQEARALEVIRELAKVDIGAAIRVLTAVLDRSVPADRSIGPEPILAPGRPKRRGC
jgi:hypothetical protein